LTASSATAAAMRGSAPAVFDLRCVSMPVC
jgi:hypothetical protein